MFEVCENEQHFMWVVVTYTEGKCYSSYFAFSGEDVEWLVAFES